MNCVFCESSDCKDLSLKKGFYHFCRSCGGWFLDSSCFLDEAGQKERYLMHHNSIEDAGYKDFLLSFIKPVLDFFAEKKGRNPELIVDYGSGPSPELCRLLSIILPDCNTKGWDPFFAPDSAALEQPAELVTCLEVAEHFEKPLEDMKKLASVCASGGIVAIGTMLNPGADEEAFRNWWYRSDSTHVSFYSLESLKKCAEKAGLTFLGSLTDRAFVFQKN